MSAARCAATTSADSYTSPTDASADPSTDASADLDAYTAADPHAYADA
ncbi:hypothetical protein GCM10029976_034860 [Kribbella albertanoniae]